MPTPFPENRPQVLAFLQAIKDNPEDDVPRLILADWLSDEGDPRGELIRLQCRLDELPPKDERRSDVQNQIRALQDRYLEEWLGPLAQVGYYWEQRRGLLYLQSGIDEIVGRTEEPADEDASWVWLESAWLDSRGRFPAERLACSPLLGALVRLNLYHARLELDDLRLLTHSPQMSRMVELSLTYNRLGNPGAEILAQAAPLQRLRDLDLSSFSIDDIGCAALAQSPHLGSLRRLNLGLNQIGEIGFTLLFFSRNLTSLCDLQIDNNEIGDGALEALVSIPHPSGLTHLDLFHNHIGDAGARALANSLWAGRLRFLDLRENPIGPTGKRLLVERFGDAVFL
jgi:uncharacterized protein (TIGR02996 family)